MVDEYKKAVQAQRQKTAYLAVGAAFLIHVLFILSKWVVIAAGLAGVGVLLYALYTATTGRRMSMGVAFVLSVAIHAVVLRLRLSLWHWRRTGEGAAYYFSCSSAHSRKELRLSQAARDIRSADGDATVDGTAGFAAGYIGDSRC